MARGMVLCLFAVILCLYQPTSGQDYVIDTLVVFDTPAFNSWLNREPSTMSFEQKSTAAAAKIKEYISLVIRQANQRLATLSDQNIKWTIQLSVTEFNIGPDPLQGAVHTFTNTVPVETGLEVLQKWVVDNGLTDHYDYVILMTGHTLQRSGNIDTKGIATVGTLCASDGTSVSLVEDGGGFQSSYIVAHEMGHSLGANHDGDALNTACPGQDRYLMAASNNYDVTSSNRENPWYFSQCSKDVIGSHMVQKILKEYPSCLTDTQTASPEFKATEGLLVGQIYNANQQCQNMYGLKSRLCLGSNFSEFRDVCTSMYCFNPRSVGGKLTCFKHWAAEGTSCDEGKLCQMGRCVEHPLAPKDISQTGDPNCPFGDSLVTIHSVYTCSQYVTTRPYSCYDAALESACCGTCGKIKSKSEACPYGDRRSGCSKDLCNMVDADGTRVEELCCQTCGYDVIKTCSDVDKIDGMTCARRANGQFWQGCYNTSVAYHCCKTCQSLRTKDKGCEYGDRSVGDSCQTLIVDKSSCDTHAGQCCKTCLDLNQGNRLHGQGSNLIWVAAVTSVLSWLLIR